MTLVLVISQKVTPYPVSPPAKMASTGILLALPALPVTKLVLHVLVAPVLIAPLVQKAFSIALLPPPAVNAAMG